MVLPIRMIMLYLDLTDIVDYIDESRIDGSIVEKHCPRQVYGNEGIENTKPTLEIQMR